jgi:hypothetical protein
LAKINPSNPLLGYSDPSAITQIMIGLVGTTSSQQALLKAGAGNQYQIAPSPASSVIVNITGVATTPQAAVLSANLVTQAAKNALYKVQANQGVNPKYMIKTYQLATANQAAQKLSGKLRSLIGVLGLGVLLLFIVISIAEAMGKGKGQGKTQPSAGNGSAARTRVKARPGDQAEPVPVAGLSRYRFQSRSDANR